MEQKLAIILSILCIYSVTNALYTHTQALALIQMSGITVFNGCNNGVPYGCISLDKIREVTIAGIRALSSTSRCNITVTGGTEFGHPVGTYSHAKGYQLDISLNSCITNYITKNNVFVGHRSDGAAMYKSVSGNVYALEANRWNLLFFSD